MSSSVLTCWHIQNYRTKLLTSSVKLTIFLLRQTVRIDFICQIYLQRKDLLLNPDSYDALMKIITNSCSFQLVTNHQAESFCKTITQMTSLKFRLPRLFEIKDYCKSNSSTIPEWCYDDDSLIIKEGETVLRDTEQCYATFRLVVDK